VFPNSHGLCVFPLRHTTPGQRTQETELGLYFTKRFGAKGTGFVKARSPGSIGLKNALDNDAVIVHVKIKQNAKAVDEDDCADPGGCRLHWRTGRRGMTCSARWAAVSTLRRVLQAGHTPRPLQDQARGSRGRTRRSGRGRSSYRERLRKYLLTELRRQVAVRQQIDRNVEQFFEFNMQPAEVEQDSAGQGVHQQIQIAAASIHTMQNGTEHTGIGSAKAACSTTHSIAFLVKGNRGLHLLGGW